jgi:WD40 repeat protein
MLTRGISMVKSGSDGTVRLWDLRSGKELFRLEVGESATGDKP